MVDAWEAAAFSDFSDFSDGAFFAVLGIRKVLRGCSYFLKKNFFFGIVESFILYASTASWGSISSFQSDKFTHATNMPCSRKLIKVKQ